MRLERVGGVRVGQAAGRPQPGQHVGGGAAGQRGARGGEHAGAEPGAAERDPALEAHRHAVALEHLAEHAGLGRPAAHEHGDVLGQDARAGQLEDLGGHELRLGALAARLQQPHRAVRRPAAGGRLEQAALEVVQGVAGVGRVVLGAVLEQLVALGQRLEQLDGGGPVGERRAARLVGERHAHVGVAGERLDGVPLERRQVVEPVQEDRAGAPGGGALAQGVERRPRQALAVDGAEALEAAVVGGEHGGELARVGGRLGPVAQRLREARGADERAAELREQRPGGGGEAGSAGRAGQHLEPGVGDRRADHPLARDRPQDAGAGSGRLRDRAHEPVEGQDLGAEHDALGGQLALVVLDVGRRGNDEHRVAREGGAEALQHGAGLGGVGGSGDQREGHRGPHRVAR